MAIAPATAAFNIGHPLLNPRPCSPSSSIKTNVAAISIFASAGMAAAKFAVGIAIGSLALISEALHSSVDVIATVITWLVVRVSDRPADEEHHYGHGKFESLSALFVIALLYVLAGGIWWNPGAGCARARRRRHSRRSPSWCWRSTSPSISGARGRCIARRARPEARRWRPTRCILLPTCSAPSPSSSGWC